MRAMSSSLSLASMVLRFAIVELWCENEDNDGFSCVYVHAAEEVVTKYKDIIVGYYPDHKKVHLVSPKVNSSFVTYCFNFYLLMCVFVKLCELSKESKNKCHWRTSPSEDAVLYEVSQYPIRTEMCYAVEGKEGSPAVYIVGFSGERNERREAKLKFLSGLGLAVSVAIYDFEEDESDGEDGDAVTNELDIKKFVPARALIATPMASTNNIPALNIATIANNTSMSVDFSLGIWGKNMSDANLAAMHSVPATPRSRTMTFDGGDIGLDLGESYSPRNSPRNSPRAMGSSMMIESLVGNENDNSVFLMRDTISSRVGDIDTDRENMRRQPSVFDEESESSRDNVYAVTNAVAPNSPASADTRLQSLTPALLTLPPLDMGKLHQNKPPTIMPLLPLPQQPQQFQQQAQQSNEDIVSDGQDTARSGVTLPSLGMAANIPPTWDPSSTFSFPVAEISAKHILPNDLTIDSFADIKHIADGSNANVFLGKLRGQKVIIKMIKASVQNDAVSVHEFDVEHGLLCRVSHPNIIRIIGAGLFPRRFIVLEYLGGGTLNTMLSQNQAKPGIASRLFRKPTFTYSNLLLKARDLADAFDYIHHNVHPGACILHRDLKPDNVGFTTDGVLKLFDFGLATCVRSRTIETQKYDMTGFTGSLRYMAPESALRKAYTEKVDVYSFGILIWQMARDKVPFKGLTKEEFLRQVSAGGERPKLDSSWPAPFSSLLTRCWHSDPLQRPSFSAVVDEIDRLILSEAPARAVVKPTPDGPKALRGALIRSFSPSPAQSSWF